MTQPTANGNNGNSKPRIFWAALMERSIQDNAVLSLLGVAAHAGQRGYTLVASGYQRTDMARNKYVSAFMDAAKNPYDALVMIDCDHVLPPDLITRLARFDPFEYGVVGALAFRRGAPFDPCFFKRDPEGSLVTPLTLDGSLQRCAIVGTGAILIRRWVFDALIEKGFQAPFFRYAYKEGDPKSFPSEDVYFGMSCEQAGIDHWCDTSTEIPHLIASTVDHNSWAQWVEDHQAEMGVVDMPDDVRNPIPDTHPLIADPIAIRTRVNI